MKPDRETLELAIKYHENVIAKSEKAANDFDSAFWQRRAADARPVLAKLKRQLEELNVYTEVTGKRAFEESEREGTERAGKEMEREVIQGAEPVRQGVSTTA